MEESYCIHRLSVASHIIYCLRTSSSYYTVVGFHLLSQTPYESQESLCVFQPLYQEPNNKALQQFIFTALAKIVLRGGQENTKAVVDVYV